MSAYISTSVVHEPTSLGDAGGAHMLFLADGVEFARVNLGSQNPTAADTWAARVGYAGWLLACKIYPKYETGLWFLANPHGSDPC